MKFTILTASPGLKCTKVYSHVGKLSRSYDNVRTWSVSEARVDGLHAMADMIRSMATNQAIIRGEFIGQDPNKVRRVMHTQYNKQTGSKECDPQFVGVDRTWICIDVDSAPAHKAANPANQPNLEKAAAWIRDTYLPEEFHGVSCCYQWSSSAGVPDWSKMAIHLWFELPRPMYAAGLFRDDMVGFDHLDQRLCNPVQVHYVADPVFEGGPDPLGDARVGVLEETKKHPEMRDHWTDKSTFDRWVKEVEARRAAERERNKKSAGEMAGKAKAKSRYVERAIQRALENIQIAGVGVRHDTIYLEAHNLGQLIGGGHVYRADLEPLICDVAESVFADSPKRMQDAARIVSDGIESGERRPRDLSHVGERRQRMPKPKPKEDKPATSAADAFNAWMSQPVGCEEMVAAETIETPKEDEERDALRLIGIGFREYGTDFEQWPTLMRAAARFAMETA